MDEANTNTRSPLTAARIKSIDLANLAEQTCQIDTRGHLTTSQEISEWFGRNRTLAISGASFAAGLTAYAFGIFEGSFMGNSWGALTSAIGVGTAGITTDSVLTNVFKKIPYQGYFEAWKHDRKVNVLLSEHSANSDLEHSVNSPEIVAHLNQSTQIRLSAWAAEQKAGETMEPLTVFTID